MVDLLRIYFYEVLNAISFSTSLLKNYEQTHRYVFTIFIPLNLIFQSSKRVIFRYQEGMLQAKAADPETMALVEGATSGMVTTIELEGEDAVAEWEVS